MRKTTKRDNVNLFFSAFLVIGYVVCAYFFSSLMGTVTSATVSGIINMAIFAVFGLILFYATRVGDGKQIKRLSIPTLILVDLPAIYIIASYFAVGLPFHTELANNSTIVMLAAVALGYAIPYTFLSGFEIAPEETEAQPAEGAAEESAQAEEYSTLDIAFESEEEAQNGDNAFPEEDPGTEPAENQENGESADETQDAAK